MKLDHAMQCETVSRNLQISMQFAEKYGPQLQGVSDILVAGIAQYCLLGDAGRKRAIEVFGKHGWMQTSRKAHKVVDGVTVEVDVNPVAVAQPVELV